MEPVVISVIVGVAVYAAIVAVLPKRILAEPSPYTRHVLESLERELPPQAAEESISVLRNRLQEASLFARIFFTLPGARASYPYLVKGGISDNIEQFFGLCILALLLLVYAFKGSGILDIVFAIAGTYLFAWWYVRRRIKKRSDAFLNLFPEALDAIVRSVRSGYPINAAVRMVAENLQPPVSTEFKQVADEVAYGSTLLEALTRLSYRIPEPDVRFFVVVLGVQQEVGGNLSEVLGNLSGIIRKRKHLRMKIRALTSEGRATAWVLGSLPVFEFVALHFVAPNHLTPLFTTPLGNLVLAGAIGIMTLGVVIVRQLINMEV